ncbi:MAG: phosphatidylserine decarboxylase [Gammaproteobacteria bacterium]|nr:phosphatidylserine decarboxylase [Gammaproteobacteria bacterium]
MSDSLRAALQHVLPHHALTALVYRLTRCTVPWVKNFLIRCFCRCFGVDLREAVQPIPSAYPSFNAFFTRSLRPEARPIDPAIDLLVSPVDGYVSQVGRVEAGLLLQAKGRTYSVAALLGETGDDAGRFADGCFATLYLAPHNYHRIHMPCAARLLHMRYLPGSLFSVNEASAACIDRLFARNERLVCEFDGPGRMVLCMVGALFVGSLETVWHGPVTPAGKRHVTDFDYTGTVPVPLLARGTEMGRFNMGSTVIILFEPGRAEWDAGLAPGAEVRVGRRIGRMLRL